MFLCVDTFLKNDWPRIGLQLQLQQQQQQLLLLLGDRHGARPGSIWIPVSFSLLHWSLTHAPFLCILLLLPGNHIHSTGRRISLPSEPQNDTASHNATRANVRVLAFRNEFSGSLLKSVRSLETASVCKVTQFANKRRLSEANYCYDYFIIYYLPFEN